MFSRAIRFLLVVAAVALLLTVALSADSFTSLIPESFKAKITSIVGAKDAEPMSAEEPVEVVEEIEAVEAEQQPSEEIEAEQVDTVATTTIEREE